MRLVAGKVMDQPPWSPDLKPTVSAVISNRERRLEQNMSSDWDLRRTAFVEHIQKINPDAHDAGYVKRLESVIAAKESL